MPTTPSAPPRPVPPSRLAGALAVLALLASACGGAAAAERETLRLGYFPTVTHAPALVGIDQGVLDDALGDVRLETTPFNAGPRAVEALFSSAIDAAYVGPNPAINAHAQSDGVAVRVVAGSTSGGAALVVRDGIDDADDLRGATLATPQLGNTQDVALRAWLADEGLSTDTQGGGEVSIVPQDNAQTLDAFRTGAVDGAWVPEPWVSRLVVEAGGEVLVDERELWPEGRFPTSLLVVRTEYLEAHPDVVADLLAGHVASVERARVNEAAAKASTNARIDAVAGAPLDDEVLDAAWERLTFTTDPMPDSLAVAADDGSRVDLLDPVDLTGLVDTTALGAARLTPYEAVSPPPAGVGR